MMVTQYNTIQNTIPNIYFSIETSCGGMGEIEGNRQMVQCSYNSIHQVTCISKSSSI